MLNAKELFEKIYKEFSEYNAYKLLTRITQFHRIPGSNGLLEAADILYKWLRDNDLDSEVRYFDVDGSLRYLTIETPVPWDVYDGEIKILSSREEILHRFIDSPTMVMTYSPPGEVEGEVVYVRRGYREDFDRIDVRDKIILSSEPYFSYRYASSRGALGFIYYNPSEGVEDGVPYASVRLNKEETKIHRIPAVSISKKNAMRIINSLERGEKIKVAIRVKSVFKDSSRIPVVIAGISGKRDREIWLTAHLCHPSPGANDNASGVAALAEGLRAYKRLIDKGVLNEPKIGIRVIWTAEYLGYSAYISSIGVDNLRKLVAYNINLDMVGGDDLRTGSVLTLHRAPTPNSSLINLVAEELFENAVRGSRGLVSSVPINRSSVEPYSSGSDHDIFNVFSIPSIMIITWPDKYYHTDLDRPSNINPTMLKITGSMAYSISHYISQLDKKDPVFLLDLVESYINKIRGEKILRELLNEDKTRILVNKCLIPKYLARIYDELIQLFTDPDTHTTIINKKDELIKKAVCKEDLDRLFMDKLVDYQHLLDRKIKTNYQGVLTLREIYKRLEPDEIDELRRSIENKNMFMINVALEYLSLMKDNTIREYLQLLYADYRFDLEDLRLVLSLLGTMSRLSLVNLIIY